jgi:hypothetical protein
MSINMTNHFLVALIVTHFGKKFVASHGAQTPITMFTEAHHRLPSHMTLLYTLPTVSLLRSVVILTSHLYLVFQVVSSLHVFRLKILYAFLICPLRATCLILLIVIDLITLIVFGKEYILWRSSLCHFLHSPFYVKIFYSALSSQALPLCLLPLWRKMKCHTNIEQR